MRRRFCLMAALLAGCVGLAPPARAEHFNIDLTIESPSGRADSRWDTYPPEGGINDRPVLRCKAGEPLNISWMMRSVYVHGLLKDVKVNFFICPIKAVGQKTDGDVKQAIVQNTLRMTFKPDFASRGNLRMVAPPPGVYLVRLENIGTLKDHGHEHFTAIDLVVE